MTNAHDIEPNPDKHWSNMKSPRFAGPNSQILRYRERVLKARSSRRLTRNHWVVTAVAAVGLVACGGEGDSACIRMAKESLELSKDIAEDKWEDKQYEISKTNDRQLRLIQRQASSDARNLAITIAEEKFEKAKKACDAKNGADG